ncbi:hypothetical protein BGZ83_010731 [Gryganskiella cystojenkinii]|nr:hypothetical protein BGZ83_010731 [Gryganskiella cystojenkinii]
MDTQVNPPPLRSLLDLPPELLTLVLKYLSKHDCTVCVRVNLDWYNAFIDTIYFTVDITNHYGSRSAFSRLRKNYSSPRQLSTIHNPMDGDGEDKNTNYLEPSRSSVDTNKDDNENKDNVVSISRNLHRICVLKVQHASILDLFFFDEDQHSEPLSELPLKELLVQLEDDPPQPEPFKRQGTFLSSSIRGLFGAVSAPPADHDSGLPGEFVGVTEATNLGSGRNITDVAVTTNNSDTNNDNSHPNINNVPSQPPTTLTATTPLIFPASTLFGTASTTTGHPATVTSLAISNVQQVEEGDATAGRSTVSPATNEALVPLFAPAPPVPLPPPPLPTPIDIQHVLQLLTRSKHLTSFCVHLGPLITRRQFKDHVKLLAALPSSLERLTLISRDHGHNTSMPELEPQEREQILSQLRSSENNISGNCVPNLRNLKSITLGGFLGGILDTMISLVMERAPALEEFSLVDCCSTEQTQEKDAAIAKLISKGSSRGWKTLGFHWLSETFGSQTVAAILEHAAPTLENLRIGNPWKAFNSAAIQKLLCSAPNLRRFDMIPTYGCGNLEQYMLLADDIVNSSESWACLELESFKCMIGGVPRPDIQQKTNSRPLTDIDLHNRDRYNLSQSRSVQRQVLAQLGRLTNLREITLGLDNVLRESEHHETYWEDEEIEGVYHNIGNLQIGRQYQCLSMTLDCGLDELRGLGSLRRMYLDNMSHGQGPAEVEWMKTNCPDFGKNSVDSFWTDRGHHVYLGMDRSYSGLFFDDPPYDWW